MNLSERYRRKLDDKVQDPDVKLDGVLLQLEVTNACNHRCVFCPNVDSSRKRTMMDFELARRVMRECADFLGKDRKVCFHMNGEPLLYKRLPELIAYSKELDYGYSFITTNGSVARPELLTELFEAGLDSIKFSINAGSRETYKKIHGADDYDNAMNALRFSCQYRKEHNKSFKIFVSCVGTKENYDELTAFQELARQYCDEVVFYYPCAYAGQKIEKAKALYCDLSTLPIESFEIKHTVPCAVLWNSINVTCEGYLALCCSESDNRLVIEDIRNMGIKEAWLGEKMTAIRKGHLENRVEHMPCFSCIYEKTYDTAQIDRELFALSLDQQ
ncbi:MAG: radical SAM protein [Ruminococcus sp.]|nr:radical SAM protein [Ruminococcus sp.]MCM1154683.1 radical SAM protein [Roseburia sp.]MCM1233928.1 radical SAM protein [Ruminococcus flavefaciens]